MKKLIILLLLLACKLYSQSYEYIKNQDTIFIILKESEKQISQEYRDFIFHTSGNGKINQYRVTAPDKPQLSIMTVNNYFKNITVRRKKFLKEYKRKIVDIDFMDKVGWLKFISIMIHKSHGKIYIINEDDLEKKWLTLKIATVNPSGFVEM